jgi:uncharacterized membrane protein
LNLSRFYFILLQNFQHSMNITPKLPDRMQARLTYFLFLASITFWCLGFVVAPLLVEYPIAMYVRQLYGTVCHQLDAHSFHLDGSPLAVCIRCSALYGGFLIGTLLVPFVRGVKIRFLRSRYAIPLLVIPMLLDVAATWIIPGYASTDLSRLLSGGLFGIATALILVPLFLTAVRQITDPHSPYSMYHKRGDPV